MSSMDLVQGRLRSLILSGLLLPSLALLSCKSEPPKVWQLSTSRSPEDYAYCVFDQRKDTFLNLSPPHRALAFGAGDTTTLMVTEDDQQIAIYLGMDRPQLVVVRSPKPLSDAQIKLLGSCSQPIDD